MLGCCAETLLNLGLSKRLSTLCLFWPYNGFIKPEKDIRPELEAWSFKPKTAEGGKKYCSSGRAKNGCLGSQTESCDRKPAVTAGFGTSLVTLLTWSYFVRTSWSKISRLGCNTGEWFEAEAERWTLNVELQAIATLDERSACFSGFK